MTGPVAPIAIPAFHPICVLGGAASTTAIGIADVTSSSQQETTDQTAA